MEKVEIKSLSSTDGQQFGIIPSFLKLIEV